MGCKYTCIPIRSVGIDDSYMSMHVHVFECVFEYVVKGDQPSICSSFFFKKSCLSVHVLRFLLKGISLDLWYVQDDPWCLYIGVFCTWIMY